MALATLVYNLSTLAHQNIRSDHSSVVAALPTLRGLPGLCIRMATSLLLFTAPKGIESVTHYPPEVPYRLLMALGTALISTAPTDGASVDAEKETTLRLRRVQLVGSVASGTTETSDEELLAGWERVRKVLSFWIQCNVAAHFVRRCAGELLKLLE